jgi:hypothetical protein
MRARRLPVIDEYVDGEEAAVFVDDKVLVLSPLATHLLALVGYDWTELTTLAEAVVDAFGAPPGGQSADEATSDALRTLEAQGIVTIADPVTETVPSQSI